MLFRSGYFLFSTEIQNCHFETMSRHFGSQCLFSQLSPQGVVSFLRRSCLSAYRLACCNPVFLTPLGDESVLFGICETAKGRHGHVSFSLSCLTFALFYGLTEKCRGCFHNWRSLQVMVQALLVTGVRFELTFSRATRTTCSHISLSQVSWHVFS